MNFIQKTFSILLTIAFCSAAVLSQAQVNQQQTPTPTPVPTPTTPPAVNPANPLDTPAIRTVPPPSPNQPHPVPITPAPQTFPKSDGDSVFRNNDSQRKPIQRDSLPAPKK